MVRWEPFHDQGWKQGLNSDPLPGHHSVNLEAMGTSVVSYGLITSSIAH